MIHRRLCLASFGIFGASCVTDFGRSHAVEPNDPKGKGNIKSGNPETSLGHYILLGASKRLVLTDPSGQVCWEMPWGNIHDIHVGDDGTILTRRGKTQVVRIDPKTKKVIWSYDAKRAGQGPIEIHAFQSVGKGRYMIALSGRREIIEVNEKKEIVHRYSLTVENPKTHSDTRLVRRDLDGNDWVAHENDGKVRKYDSSGNVLWEYEVPMFDKIKKPGHGPDAFGNSLFAALPLGNGDVLIATGNGHSVLRVNPQKEITWQISQHEIPGVQLAWVTTLEVTDDGHYLIGNCHAGPKQPILIEVDPASKSLVWQLNGHARFGNNVSNSTMVRQPWV